MKHSIYYTLTTKCNLNCGYCFKESLHKASTEEFSVEEIKKVIDHLYNNFNIRRLTLSGGEPSLLGGKEKTDFIELINYLRLYKSSNPDKNLEVILLSNAILLTPEVTEVMKGVVDRVTVTLDSIDDEILTKLGRSNDAHKNYLKRIEKRFIDFKDKGFQIKLHSVVTKQNISSLEDMVKYVQGIKDINIKSWKFYQYMNFGDSDKDDIYFISKEEFYNEMNKVEKLFEGSNIKLIYKNIDEEKDTIFNLLPNGCIRYNVQIGDQFEERFSKCILNYKNWDELLKDTTLSDNTISDRTLGK